MPFLQQRAARVHAQLVVVFCWGSFGRGFCVGKMRMY